MSLLPGAGSSPLARGTHPAPYNEAAIARLIPARAGNTHRAAEPHHFQPAHPRSRGEHDVNLSHKEITGGSSPLARGTRFSVVSVISHLLAHPRSRGEHRARSVLASGFSFGAHPRSRGEHFSLLSAASRRLGSSPLARGTRFQSTGSTHAFRLIPARAGNTGRSRSPASLHPAHPRSRGEHGFRCMPAFAGSGSSPLARGTLGQDTHGDAVARLIPARAGNTTLPALRPCRLRAHPRSRGEHLIQLPHRRYQPRLIPARAGNTLADMGFYPLHQQNRITLKPEPASRIHDKQ